MTSHSDVFANHRGLLFSVAYRVTGSVSDAEDAVQDSWLRWSRVELEDVREPKAYLVRVVTNVALDKLRAAAAAREQYVGPWLPEPLVTRPDVADEIDTGESVSMAMLVVLETLNPQERAVFVLREVFGFAHAEIAEALQRSEESVRQLAHRARSHVRSRRPRFRTDHAQRTRATERFLRAACDGDLSGLLEALAPDVAIWTDGGGRVRAARYVIVGADKASRFLTAITSGSWQGIPVQDMVYTPQEINGEPGIVVYHAGRAISTIAVDVGDTGLIGAVYIVGNPQKLRAIPQLSTLDDTCANGSNER